jgi:molecular chaperone GrpE
VPDETENRTTARQAGDPEAEATSGPEAEEDRSTAPEPDKLTAAQQGADPEAEAASEPAAASDAGEAEAGEAENAEADAEEQVITERADEEPDGAPAGEAAAEEDGPAAIVADLAAARAEADGYLDDLRRLQADFDNYRKRMLREQTARIASASQGLVARLLPVLDNFELAVSHAEQSRDFDRMLKGVEMVFGELREVLQGEGLVKIEAEGKPFDPERHEAVVAVEQEGAEPGTVMDVVRTGYELRGKVLRPAMVKVAK